jgi:hypothetical protein
MYQSTKFPIFLECLKSLVTFLILATISIALYYQGLIALPKADHAFILAERNFYNSDWDFFKNMISFSRTRHVAPGDAFLFRPGTHALLGLIDIFLRPNLFAIGFLSIFWHAITAWTIFLTGQLVKSTWIGFLLAIWFIVQFSGIDMILWRHISPYIFSLIFFSIGLALLNSAKSTPSSSRLLGCSCLFFLSMCFHEFLSIALPITGLLMLTRGVIFEKRYNYLSITQINLICFIPSLLFFLLNFLDFYLNTAQVLVLNDAGNSANPKSIFNAIYFIGLCFTAYFIPYLINFQNLREKTSWDFFSALPKQFFLVFGLISLIIICYSYFNHLKRKSTTTNDFSFILICNYILILIGSLVILRMNMRGMVYMKFATYYFYFTNYLVTLIFIYKADSIVNYLKYKLGSVYFLRLRVLLLLFYFSTIVLSTTSILFTLEKYTTPNDKLMTSLTYFVAQNTEEPSNFCYAGSHNGASQFVDDRLLFRHHCALWVNKIPIHLKIDANEAFELTNNDTVHIKYK